MKTPCARDAAPAEILSLRAILAGADHRSGAMLSAPCGEIAFADLARRGPLGDRQTRLAGRSVILKASSQFAAALALIDLDGVAESLVLWPPDLGLEHLPAIALAAGATAIVFDGEPPANAPAGVELIAFDPRRLAPRAAAAVGRRTRWAMFTSGTSGVPKMVAHTLQSLTGAIGDNRPGEGDVVWATFYDIRRYGGLQILLRAILGGASMVLSDEGEAVGAFLERLGRHRASHISGTPSHWRRALMSGHIGRISPRVVRLSGEIADQAVLAALRDAFPGASIGHAYASTEVGVAFEVADGLEGFPAALVEHGAGAVELAVVDDTLRVRSRRIAAGYVGSGGATLAGEDGFVDTGDLLERRGERYHFLGRRGGVINVGGLKVSPEEVEAVINRHPGVAMSRVSGRRSPITGAIVVAEVVPADASSPGADQAGLRASILDACRHCLPAFKTPAAIRIVPALELGANGKVARLHA
ncbi:MAG TPA: fatty acid--CoA ligase family protein [Caulobacteraceae bacterium]